MFRHQLCLASLIAFATGSITVTHISARESQPASSSIQQEVRSYLRNLGISTDRANALPIYCTAKHCTTTGNGIWINERQLATHPPCLRSFYLAHEAAHYALGHYRSITTIGQEQEADIAAARMFCRYGQRAVVEEYANYLQYTVIPQEGSKGRVDKMHPTFSDELRYLQRILAE